MTPIDKYPILTEALNPNRPIFGKITLVALVGAVALAVFAYIAPVSATVVWGLKIASILLATIPSILLVRHLKTFATDLILAGGVQRCYEIFWRM